jgi:hypothetical protein
LLTVWVLFLKFQQITVTSPSLEVADNVRN